MNIRCLFGHDYEFSGEEWTAKIPKEDQHLWYFTLDNDQETYKNYICLKCGRYKDLISEGRAALNEYIDYKNKKNQRRHMAKVMVENMKSEVCPCCGLNEDCNNCYGTARLYGENS